MNKQQEKIFRKFDAHIKDMTSRHSKVLTTRLDIRFPVDYGCDDQKDRVKQFVEYYVRDLKTNNPLPEEGRKRSSGRKEQAHQVDPRIICVVEQHGDNPHMHAHLMVLVNGNAKRSSWDMMKKQKGSGLMHCRLKMLLG